MQENVIDPIKLEMKNNAENECNLRNSNNNNIYIFILIKLEQFYIEEQNISNYWQHSSPH